VAVVVVVGAVVVVDGPVVVVDGTVVVVVDAVVVVDEEDDVVVVGSVVVVVLVVSVYMISKESVAQADILYVRAMSRALTLQYHVCEVSRVTVQLVPVLQLRVKAGLLKSGLTLTTAWY